jgi:hypothetical protein
MKAFLPILFLLLPTLQAHATSCSYADYERLSLASLSHVESRSATMQAIVGAFASLFLMAPDRLHWAGMASIGQAKLAGILPVLAHTDPLVRDAALTTVDQVFKRGYIPLLVYLTGGMPEVYRLAGPGPHAIPDELVDILRTLDRGDASSIREANGRLLAREHEILQTYFYGGDIGLLDPALSAFACANFSNVPWKAHCFAARYPFSSFTDLEKRTEWNVHVLLPSFEKNARDRVPDLRKIRSDGQRVGARYLDPSSGFCK